ncbi:MAG: folylpolyglutamate synthase/dihydrofolate synthase family protein [Candidatus Omnitrophota bacterium]
MAYPETIQYLESFINYEKIAFYPYKDSLKLERIKNFLFTIGNPQDTLKCIHIAGTKGKGSTCAFISYILRQAGFKVGLYTSPHLSDFRERIRILKPRSEACLPTASLGFAERRAPRGEPARQGRGAKDEFEGMIGERELTDLTERLKPKIEDYNKNSKYGALSFFEVYTALAFVYFKEKNVDFAILETGLGGRLDATNVVKSLVCAITQISYEHTQKLGNTLTEIAVEKTGIIKSQNVTKSQGHQLIVVSAPQEREAIEVIQNQCREVGARLYEVGKDITYKGTNGRFQIKGIFNSYQNLNIKLIGEHQITNACLALGVIEALNFFNIKIDSEFIRKGLSNTIWPGRCEVVSKMPLIVLDGAQNTASAKALKHTIKSNFKFKRLILILGISKDKDIKGICSQLFELADFIFLTKANNPRALDPETIVNYFSNKKTFLTTNVADALNLAKKEAKQEDLILITGSLFVVGESREIILR